MKKELISNMFILVMFFAFTLLLQPDISIYLGAVFVLIATLLPSGFNIMISLISALIVVFFAPSIQDGLIITLGFVVPAIVQGAAIRKNKSLSFIIGAGTLARAVSLFLYYYHVSCTHHTTIRELLVGSFSEEMMLDFVKMGYSEESIKIIEDMWEFASGLIPSIVLISSVSFSAIVFVSARFILKRSKIIFPNIRNFVDIRLEPSFAIFIIAVFAALFFTEGEFFSIVSNMAYFLLPVCMVAGICSFVRFFRKNGQSKIVIAFSAVFFGIVSFGSVYLILGIISSFMKDKKLSV